jgi:tetratricopeptide (TPR) repeat protein
VPAISGLLLLAMGLVFAQAVGYGFVDYDDPETVYEHPQITQGLTGQGVGWAFTHRHVFNWVPLTCISHMLDWQLYGPAAGGHHLTNLVLHAATAVLLFLVLRSMTGRLWPSALAAVLFAVHPLRVESVAWVTERKDVLSGLFFVLTLAAYVGYARHRFSMLRYLGIMIFFAMGLMAKPMLVTLPLVLLLLDYWPLRRGAERADLHAAPSPPPPVGRFPWRLVIEKLPLLLLVAVSSVATLTQGKALAANERLSFAWRICNALISYVIYVGQSLYPAGLAVLYPRADPDLPLPLARACGAFVLLAGVTAVTLLWRRRRPYLLVGWLWYLIMLVPVIGVVQIGIQALADRFTYLPQIGLCMAAAWGAADVARAWPRRRWACSIVSALVLAVLMGSAWRQTSFWRDSETLWEHTLACTPENAAAHCMLGNTLSTRGRTEEAVVHLRQAVELNPAFAKAHYDLGLVLAQRGRDDEAMAQYQAAVETDPTLAIAQCNFGNALSRRGRFDEAMVHYQTALDVNPNLVEAQYNLGAALVCRGRFDEAVACFRTALLLAEQQNNRPMAAAARAGIARFEAGKSLSPLRSPSHGSQTK